jgi:hypothetical protein
MRRPPAPVLAPASILVLFVALAAEPEFTCFQTSRPFSEGINVGADVAIVYGIDASLPDRLKTWRDRGYVTHLMTGVSWGSYQDYLYGRFDGIHHEDEAQTDAAGRKISHGGDIYYMCPGTNYGRFLSVGVERAIRAGASAVHLEEPEFWVRAGYSEGFKREWRAAYGEDWRRPDGSADAQWRASKLKYRLYQRALQQVFDRVHELNRELGRDVKCYVPTHSLLNYAHWNIVSPESSLAGVGGCDGYIAQVWTGTARTPVVYGGVERERTFDVAFLEYGAALAMSGSTGRRMWLLADPIEDDPKHTWEDYRSNWEATVAASLLHPSADRFEVVPWPERVFSGKYPQGSPDARPMAAAYGAELQIVFNALGGMSAPAGTVRWEGGARGFGVVVADSMMFERAGAERSDGHLGYFYGLALPLLKRGVAVAPVQLDSIGNPGALADVRVLFLTYRGMKPLSPAPHAALAAWVKAGGALVVWDDDGDPFNKVREWWNSDGATYATPREALFDTLGLNPDQRMSAAGGDWINLGRGAVRWVRQNPVELTRNAQGSGDVAARAREAAEHAGIPWREANHLVLRRGNYVIAAGLDESIGGAPKVLGGAWVDLFDPTLSVQHDVALTPGSRRLLVDLARVARGGTMQFIGAAARVRPEGTAPLHWSVTGVTGTRGSALLWSPGKTAPTLTLDGQSVGTAVEPATDGLLLRFEIINDGVVHHLAAPGGR